MSYTIVYDRKFLKDSKGRILPLILCGDNNVTTVTWNGRERRAREWCLYGNTEFLKDTPEEMMRVVQDIYGNPSESDREVFKFNSKWVTSKQVVSFFKNGIANAYTLEEINDIKPGYGVLRCYTQTWMKEEFSAKTTNDQYIRTSEELTKWVDAALKERETLLTAESISSVYLCIGFASCGDNPLTLPRKTAAPLDGPVVAKYRNGYITDVKGSGFTYKRNGEREAHIFADIEEAKKMLPSGYNFTFVKAANVKPKDFVILSSSGFGYFSKLTSTSARYAFNKETARGFESAKAARDYLLKNNFFERFTGTDRYVILNRENGERVDEVKRS